MKKTVKYLEIRDELKKWMRNGCFADGKFPALSSLVQEFDASLMTVNRAVKELEAEGLVICNSGRIGTRVNLPGVRRLCRNENHFGENLMRHREVTLRLLEVKGQFPAPFAEEVIRLFCQRYPWIRLEYDCCDALEDVERSSYDLIICRNADALTPERAGEFLNLEKYHAAFPFDGVFPVDERYSVCLLWNTPILYYDREEPFTDWRDVLVHLQGLRKNGKSGANILGLWSFLHSFGNDYDTALDVLNEFALCETRWNNLDHEAVLNAWERGDDLSLLLAYPYVKCRKNVMLPPSVTGRYLAASVRCGICAKSRYPKDAMFFLHFLRSEEVQKLIVKYGYGCPFRKQVFHKEFAQTNKELYRILRNVGRDVEEFAVSEEMQSAFYMYVYPLLERYFCGELSKDETACLIQHYKTEIIKMDGVL